MKLSVGIITFNEEVNLPKTLEAAKKIADEIIIVDSHSTDNTVKLAESYGATVYVEDWKGFGPQKNSVLDKCKGEWILLIDADEELSDELADRIKEIVDGKSTHDVYNIKRLSICFGKELKYGEFSNDYQTRLWKNGVVRVNENLVHEEYITEKPKGKISEEINHYSYHSMHDYFERINKYTTLGAQEYFKRGRKASNLQIIFNPIFKFIKMYIIKLGFLDGIEGLTMACASATFSMIKYFKLREIYKTGVYKR